MKTHEYAKLHGLNSEKVWKNHFQHNLHTGRLPVTIYSCPHCKEILWNFPILSINVLEENNKMPMKQTVITVIIIIIILLTGCSSESEKKSVQSVIKSQQFEQIGYYKTDQFRGFTYYVKNPSQESIKDFCERKRNLYQTLLKKRILKIHFFDNRENTPDVSFKYYFPESSDAYMIADYVDNPWSGAKNRLRFHKQIQ